MSTSERVESFKREVCSSPPRCVRGLRLTPVPPRGEGFFCPVVFALACPCGEAYGSILGYPLGRFIGAENDPGEFVGPLAFECSQCGQVGEVIDTAQHGYHGSGIGSAVYRGEGPRTRFRCPGCGCERFGVLVQFDYWPAVFDLEYEEPGVALQDCFTGFQAYGTCAECQRQTTVAGFDT